MTLALATRGSPLALWQAQTTRAALLAAHPDARVELITVQSSGDRDRATDLARFGSIGIFTVEVDRAVLDGRARIGVHSLKDMTTTLEDGSVLAAVLPRGPVEDVLVAPPGTRLADLPAGARVATGSLRRAAMVRRARPDLEVVGIRGNVDTRLAKLDAGEAEALVMARAGLVRLGLEQRIAEVLDHGRFLPAVGQGLVGLTCAAGDHEAREQLAAINDPSSWAAALAERALLRALHGGCNAPIGGHARALGANLSLAGRVLSPDGKQCVEGARKGATGAPEELGEALAVELLARGAGAIVADARN